MILQIVICQVFDGEFQGRSLLKSDLRINTCGGVKEGGLTATLV